MRFANRLTWVLRALVATAAVSAALWAGASSSVGDLQSQISAGQSAAQSLQSTIAADSARIRATTDGLQRARAQLAALQWELSAREAQLRRVQGDLLAARDRLVVLENRLHAASVALAANLVARYEGSQPDIVTVILEAHGFNDLLERMSFMERVGHQDGQIVAATRAARAAVAREANALAALEQRDRILTDQVLGQRNQVAALQAALLSRQISEIGSRATDAARLGRLNARLSELKAKAAAEAAAAARAAQAAAAARAAQAAQAAGPAQQSSGGPSQSTGVSLGGIAVDTGGMVQAPPGAPAAVAQVIAAGNAIATLPYVWGGGHGSFHADGYDCSGSVSYALAAAGLLSSPLDSTGFESWGEPGPGQWITVYANAGHAFMVVAGWRFDTVALGEGGTRWSQTMADTSGFVARHPPGL
jgi:cell wall-associated NlpC family hydrolase